MAYGKLLRRAWDITWHHKALWAFGILAAIFTGSLPWGYVLSLADRFEYQLGTSDMEQLFGRLPAEAAGLDWAGVAALIAAITGVTILVGIVVTIVGLVVRYTSEGALICGAVEVERSGSTRLSSALHAVWPKMIGLLLADLALGIAGFFAFLPVLVILLIGLALAIGPAIALGASDGGAAIAGAIGMGLVGLLVWVGVTVLVAIAVGGVVTVLREYAFRAIALEGRGIFDAIGDAWRMARRTVRRTLTTWLILGLISLGLGVAMLPVASVAAIALVGIVAGAYGLTQSITLPAILAVPAVLVLVAASAAVSGVYYTFRSAAWTLVYRELKPESLPVVQGPTI